MLTSINFKDDVVVELDSFAKALNISRSAAVNLILSSVLLSPEQGGGVASFFKSVVDATKEEKEAEGSDLTVLA